MDSPGLPSTPPRSLWTALPYHPPGIPRHPGHQASLLPPQALAQNSSSALQAQSWGPGTGGGWCGGGLGGCLRSPSSVSLPTLLQIGI